MKIMIAALYLSCVFWALASAYSPHIQFIPTLESSTLRPCPCKNPAYCQQIETSPTAEKEGFIFSVHKDNWKMYDWKKITTIAMFNYFDDELMCFAHSQNVRVVFGTDFPMENLTSASDRTNWVKGQLQIAQYYFLDGVNLDFETNLHDKKTGQGLTLLVQELATTFRKTFKNPQISQDTRVNPDYNAFFDMKALSSAVDFFVIMAYDESSAEPGANSNYVTNEKGMHMYFSRGVPSDKLVLALPWYGYNFDCVKYEAGNKCIVAQTCTELGCVGKNAGLVAYIFVVHYLNTSTTGRLWDTASKSPYFTFKNTDTGRLNQIWYDDPPSLKLKNNIVDSLHLGGYAMWHADCVDYADTVSAQKEREEMWGTLPDKK